MKKGEKIDTAREREAFGAKLRAERRRLGLTQQWLASAAGVGISTLVNAELGVHYPQPRTRAAILAALEEYAAAAGK